MTGEYSQILKAGMNPLYNMKTIVKLFKCITFIFSIVFVCSCKKDVVDNTPPTLQITSPSSYSGNTICNNVNISVQVNLRPNEEIARVEFIVDGQLLVGGAITQPPYKYVWNCTDRFGEIRHIVAKAYNKNGAIGSDTVDVMIWNAVEKTPMPISRYAFTVETVNEKIYVIGGYDTCNHVLEEYDPAIDKWTRKSNSQQGHAAHASCVINNKIYVFGGDRGFQWATYVEMYDPATDIWTYREKIPFADSIGMGLMSCSVYNGKAYLFGGLATANNYVKVGVYDPVSNSWTENSMKNINCSVAETVNGRIYVYGGCPTASIGTCNDARNELQSYDPSTGNWSTLAHMRYNHSGHAGSLVNGKIYSIGGTTDLNNAGIETYDPLTNIWTELPSMSQGAINFGCSNVNGKIYIIGSKVYEYTPN